MKILYAIQGTGNGHISRARAILPHLQAKGQVDVLISGTQADVDLDVAVKYRLHGLSFIFGKKGGVDILETYRKNKIKRFWKEVKSLPVADYDLVINDFEPVSAWACQLKNIPCIGLSHQSAVLHPKAPRPKNTDAIGMTILKHYAPATVHYGFHFERYDRHIFPPVIRQQVRELQPINQGHYTVYLPAYDEARLINILSLFEEVQWQVFSKHSKAVRKVKNISIRPISNEAFVASMASAEGILCGAGFETPAEAMFLGKKILVIPMKGQYEQQCNAAALKKLGVPVIKSLKKKHAGIIAEWLRNGKVIPVDYPDATANIIDAVLQTTFPTVQKPRQDAALSTAKKFKDFIFRRIFSQLAKSATGLPQE